MLRGGGGTPMQTIPRFRCVFCSSSFSKFYSDALRWMSIVSHFIHRRNLVMWPRLADETTIAVAFSSVTWRTESTNFRPQFPWMIHTHTYALALFRLQSKDPQTSNPGHRNQLIYEHLETCAQKSAGCTQLLIPNETRNETSSSSNSRLISVL